MMGADDGHIYMTVVIFIVQQMRGLFRHRICSLRERSLMSSNLLPRALQRMGIHYGWAVVAVIFLTMLSTSAAMGMVGVLMLPLKAEFGWDLGAISGALALRVLLYGMVGPFAAAVMLRYGVRTIVGTALALIITGLARATSIFCHTARRPSFRRRRVSPAATRCS